MKRIAFFQTDLNYGGIQKSLINVLNSMDYKNNSADLYLVNKDNVFDNVIPKSVNVHYIKKCNYLTRLIPFKIFLKFYKCNIDKEYDIAIDFNGYSNEVSSAVIKTKALKKIIWTHNDYLNKQKGEIKFKILFNLSKSKFNYFDEIVYVSEGVKESFNKLIDTSEKEEKMIPNMINTDEIFSKKDEDNNIEVDPNVINLCSVGRLVYQKNFASLINKFNEVIAKNNKFHLYIIGDGKLRSSLERQVNNLRLNDYITFLGYQKNPFSIINKMDAFVLNSHYEGQGMVILEAASLGLDVIIPKTLEKYIEGIKGYDDIVEPILNLKKHEHKLDDLKEYNMSIIEEINNL